MILLLEHSAILVCLSLTKRRISCSIFREPSRVSSDVPLLKLVPVVKRPHMGGFLGKIAGENGAREK